MDAESIKFTFAGQELFGQPHDTVATALLRNKIRIFDRSMKLRRKRGVSCLEGYCMSCLLEVNGEPDIVTCRTPLKEGMVVKPQVAWPSPSFDFMAPFQSNAFKMFGPELYYRFFTKPIWLNEIWIRFLSSMSGRARIDVHTPPPVPLPFDVLSTQILIVGGGVAGIACAQELCTAGIQVLMVDRNKTPGGWWARWKSLGDPPAEIYPITHQNLNIPPGVQLLSETTLIGLYEDRTALAINPISAFRIHYQIVVIASGCYPKLLAFPGSDEPLNLPAQGIIRAALDTGWTPKSLVLLETDNLGLTMKNALESLGILVYLHHLPSNKVILNQDNIINSKSKGGFKLESGKRVRAEAVCWTAGYKPKLELLKQVGGVAAYQAADNVFMPVVQDDVRINESAYVAGGCAGVNGFHSSYMHGKLAGASIVSFLYPKDGMDKLKVVSEQWLKGKNFGGVSL